MKLEQSTVARFFFSSTVLSKSDLITFKCGITTPKVLFKKGDEFYQDNFSRNLLWHFTQPNLLITVKINRRVMRRHILKVVGPMQRSEKGH